MEFNIVHLYADLLNLYGDRGNIAVITQRLKWRGYNVNLTVVNSEDVIDLKSADFVLLGGGPDAAQKLVASKLQKYQQEIKNYIENEGVFLAVCGGYQLLGKSYQLEDETIPGLNLFNYETIQENGRCIGNVVIDTDLGFSIVGFENHGGRTYLTNQKPLGKVRFGYGNDGKSGFEGIHYKNCIATYIHGPLLPKNPKLADYLIKQALLRKGFTNDLVPLDDTKELKAQNIMIERCHQNQKDNPYISN